MKKIALVAATLMAAIPVMANADNRSPSLSSGNDAIENCNNPDRHAHLSAFVAGVLQNQIVSKRDALKGICAPTLEAGQVADIFCKYLQEHPAYRHFTAESLLDEALRQAFPCR